VHGFTPTAVIILIHIEYLRIEVLMYFFVKLCRYIVVPAGHSIAIIDLCSYCIPKFPYPIFNSCTYEVCSELNAQGEHF
jgi:hypothetical protein